MLFNIMTFISEIIKINQILNMMLLQSKWILLKQIQKKLFKITLDKLDLVKVNQINKIMQLNLWNNKKDKLILQNYKQDNN